MKVCTITLLVLICLFCLTLAGHPIMNKDLAKSTLWTGIDNGLSGKLESMVCHPQHGAGESIIWDGESGGWFIRWTTSDLYVQSAGQMKKIWKPLVESDFADFTSEQEKDSIPSGRQPVSYEYQRIFRVLSVVGSIVSFEDSLVIFFGHGSPGINTRFTSIDLAGNGQILYSRLEGTSPRDVNLDNPGKIAKLTDYFAEEDVLRALLADRIIKKALAALDKLSAPQTLTGLPELFKGNGYELGNTGFELRPDFLTRFVFHHIEGDKIAVRMGLPPHYGVNKAQHLQIGILLDIPPTLKNPAFLAATNKEGFMMQSQRKIAGKQDTEFIFKRDFTKN